jgi:hypothetical protein
MEVKVKRLMSKELLRQENVEHLGSGGCSRDNAGLGFRPAFYDFATQRIYASRFADGRLAPFHLLDGLPDEVVIDRTASGRVTAVKATVISGFLRNGYFYTRTAAARAVEEWTPAPGHVELD